MSMDTEKRMREAINRAFWGNIILVAGGIWFGGIFGFLVGVAIR